MEGNEGGKRAEALVRRLIVAGLAARFAVHQTVSTHANVGHCLAQTAKFLALAEVFGLLALCATISGGAGSAGHGANVARGRDQEKMTLVISGARCCTFHRPDSAL